MRVEIKFFASLSPYATHPRISADGHLDLPSPVLVGEIVDELAIPRTDIKLIFLNGVHARMDSLVKDRDRLGFFPPIGGG